MCVCVCLCLFLSFVGYVRPYKQDNAGDISIEEKEKRTNVSFLLWKERRLNGQSSLAFFLLLCMKPLNWKETSGIRYLSEKSNLFSLLNFNQRNGRHRDDLKEDRTITVNMWLTFCSRDISRVQCVIGKFISFKILINVCENISTKLKCQFKLNVY